MQEKIKWYEEILAVEPGSKLFYPLAWLYLQEEELDKAAAALISGLEKHPEFFQARVLLLEVLDRQGREQELENQMHQALEEFSKNSRFWDLAADYFERRSDPDLAVALRYLGQALQSRHTGWVQLLQQALKQGVQGSALSQQDKISEPEARPGTAPDSEALGLSPGENEMEFFQKQNTAQEEQDLASQGGSEELEQKRESHYKTATMAEIMAEQGDYQGAGDIYSWLVEQTESETKRAELRARREELLQQVQEIEAPQAEQEPEHAQTTQSKDNSLLHKLEKLASRLEARDLEA